MTKQKKRLDERERSKLTCLAQALASTPRDYVRIIRMVRGEEISPWEPFAGMASVAAACSKDFCKAVDALCPLFQKKFSPANGNMRRNEELLKLKQIAMQLFTTKKEPLVAAGRALVWALENQHKKQPGLGPYRPRCVKCLGK